MFVDEARIWIEAGRGGDGAVAFRREKYVPRGGPAGGDGGRGGDIIFEVSTGLSTLMDLRHQTMYRAESGHAGGNNNRSGRQGEDLVVRVPPGTLILTDQGELVADLTAPDARMVVAKGGRGGRGNAHFASATHRVPRIAERGQAGEAFWARLELRLLADVGLVGFPNVGKSTLVSRVSEARPRIADYPFTTLVPHLGVVSAYGDSFVMADVPGLIEGAHEGAGLGHAFLKHLQRTRVMVHLVDMNPLSGRDPWQDYRVIRHELTAFSPELAERHELVAATKMDLDGAQDRLEQFRGHLPGGTPVFPISAVTGEGLDALGYALRQLLDTVPVEPLNLLPRTLTPRPLGWRLEADGAEWRLFGDVAERAEMTRWGHYEDEMYLAEYLRRRGVFDALRRAGALSGARIHVGPGTLAWVEDSLMPEGSREALAAQEEPPL